ncbi:hypothetical protein D3C85_1326680 [compost metagenome]
MLEARYFQAKTTVMIMTGITTSSIRPVAIRIRFFCSMPTWPFGSSRVQLHPLSKSMPKKGKMPNSLG